MVLTIFCSWCNKHEFKVDSVTAENAGIIELQCPKCKEVTSVNRRPDGTMFILPGAPNPWEQQEKSKDK